MKADNIFTRRGLALDRIKAPSLPIARRIAGDRFGHRAARVCKAEPIKPLGSPARQSAGSFCD